MSCSVAARCGFEKMSPGFGAWPPGRNVAAAAGSADNFRSLAFHCPPITSETGYPFFAYAIDGASARDSGIVPCASSSVAQPSTTPGTLTDYGPVDGIAVRLRALNPSAVLT